MIVVAGRTVVLVDRSSLTGTQTVLVEDVVLLLLNGSSTEGRIGKKSQLGGVICCRISPPPFL